MHEGRWAEAEQELNEAATLFLGAAPALAFEAVVRLVPGINRITLTPQMENFNKHIVTLEDPIEYYHSNDKSSIAQREVGNDTPSFAATSSTVFSRLLIAL